ncbi:tetratricopeptide repeat protein [Spirosoma aerolatum]|uniref:tetratricopeptide repeat protein n=1 Tax=Spirosoma aerolatum TaxID=1211326 RepID=UPI0009AEB523|nr:sel1 repeat family protein [Spirosoma aerolatum]
MNHILSVFFICVLFNQCVSGQPASKDVTKLIIEAKRLDGLLWYKKAEMLYQKLEKTNKIEAQVAAARFYIKYREQYKDNQARAYAILAQAKAAGSLEAKFVLSDISADFTKPLPFIKNAAEQGLPEAQTRWAMFALLVKKDTSEYIKWQKLASINGDGEAKYNLGAAYLSGLGVNKNLDSTTSLWKAAANLDEARAYSSLCSLYGDAKNVKYNLDSAIYWYEESVRVINQKELNRDSNSDEYLAHLYLKKGLLDKAIKYFTYAYQPVS